jgi:hypothetical protein
VEQNSTTLEVRRKTNPTGSTQGNKKHLNSRGTREKTPPKGGGVKPPPPSENHAHREGALERKTVFFPHS